MVRKLTDEQRAMFAQFMREHPRCWSCGWCQGKAKVAPDYAGPVKLENHHIVGGSGRKHARWNLARLCSICHRVHHGDRIRLSSGELLPSINRGQVLFLKRAHDSTWFDVTKLDSIAIGVMPSIEPPNKFYRGWSDGV